MNVVWFCIDTLRADHLSCYGYFRNTSPTIDRVATEGALFPQARANAVATGPAFTSMFTGQYAINCEWYVTPYDVPNAINFPDDKPVFPEVIRDAGLTTAAFDNLIAFATHMKQFVRGFEYYINVTKTTKPLHHLVVGAEVNARLLPWIRQHRDEQFFLFVHYWDPHLPYNQPDEFARPFAHERGSLDDLEVKEAPAGYRYVPGWAPVDRIGQTEGPLDFKPSLDIPHPVCIDTYDGEILYTDHLIQEVLNELDVTGILDDTAVVINADHGELLNQHIGTWGHAGLYNANIFTPLVLWRPGLLSPGVRPMGFVQHIDIAPTILDLLGLEPHWAMDGTSVLPLIENRGSLPERSAHSLGAGSLSRAREYCFAETLAMRAVEREGWKYIWHKKAQDELYNTLADPMEQINLIGEEPDRARMLEEELLLWVEKNLEDRPDPMTAQLKRMEKLRGRPYAFC
jgi:arylsulfatase A-like enzyme